MIRIIPTLSRCYDIQRIEGKGFDKNEFSLHIELYKGELNDPKNQYAAFEDSSLPIEYCPFTDSRSIAIWTTNLSKVSVESVLESEVPNKVEVSELSQAGSDEQSQITSNSKPNKTLPPKTPNKFVSGSISFNLKIFPFDENTCVFS